jgi:hypothetical protein
MTCQAERLLEHLTILGEAVDPAANARWQAILDRITATPAAARPRQRVTCVEPSPCGLAGRRRLRRPPRLRALPRVLYCVQPLTQIMPTEPPALRQR